MTINRTELNKLVEETVAKTLRNRISNINRVPRKHAASASTPRSASDHSVNLRCPREDCEYNAKTMRSLLKQGRLRCPIHHTILQTKEERGETRGRHAA